MTPESLQLLQKLCDLQQQQLDKLTEVSKHLDSIAEGARISDDQYKRQIETYEQELGAYRKRAEVHSQQASRGGVLVAIMLGLIALSIVISHFL